MSTSCDQGKLALMLLPIAALLAHVGSDARETTARKDRALLVLRKLTSKFCLSLGACADYGLVSTAFLRLFDVADHDVALSRSEIDQFVHTLHVLFLQGFVFQGGQSSTSTATLQGDLRHEAVHGVPGSIVDSSALRAVVDAPSRVSSPCFIVQHVQKTLQKRCVFHCATHPVLLWGSCSQSDLKEVSERMHNVVRLVVDRLKAEFPDHDLRDAMQAFDLASVRSALKLAGLRSVVDGQQSGQAANGQAPSRPAIDKRPLNDLREQGKRQWKKICDGFVRLARALSLDTHLALLEYKDAVPVLLNFAYRGPSFVRVVRSAASSKPVAANSDWTQVTCDRSYIF